MSLFAVRSDAEQLPGGNRPHPGADAGTWGQRLVQPAQVRLADFNPALASWRFAAVLERQADAVLIEAGVVAVAALRRKKGPQKVHGEHSGVGRL